MSDNGPFNYKWTLYSTSTNRTKGLSSDWRHMATTPPFSVQPTFTSYHAASSVRPALNIHFRVIQCLYDMHMYKVACINASISAVPRTIPRLQFSKNKSSYRLLICQALCCFLSNEFKHCSCCNLKSCAANASQAANCNAMCATCTSNISHWKRCRSRSQLSVKDLHNLFSKI